MNKPVIQKDGLTYVWETNASPDELIINGTEIRYDFGRKLGRNLTCKYTNAILGRPSGAEDFSSNKRQNIEHQPQMDYFTIAENEDAGMVGIYILKS